MQALPCPSCQSGDTYFSRKRQIWVCEDCEHAFSESTGAHGQRLFFSYGHDANSPIVLRLKKDLEERGHSVWLDSERIRTGDDWRSAITGGIMDADRIVSFLSRHSVRSPGVCLDELRIALCTKSGAIQSVLLEAEEDVLVPASLSSIQWLDLSGWRRLHEDDPEDFEQWYRSRLEELCGAVESTEAQTFAGDISSLRLNLAPKLSDTKERQLLAQPFVGRAWLTDEIRQWQADRDRSANRAFVLLGGPGVGKSRIAAELLHREPSVVCGIFLEWGRGLSSPTTVARTLAFKLAARLPDYRRLLVSLLGDATPEELDALGNDQLFNQLITHPLSQLVDGDRERILVVIDGLDEASDGGTNPLAQVLAANLHELPDWVGFVITSRPETVVPVLFRKSQPTLLSSDDPRNAHDVRQFLAEALQGPLSNSGNAHFLLERLARACQGNFLHASLLADAIQHGHLRLTDVPDMPPGLDSFYLAEFERRFSTGDTWRAARDLLELLLALHPMPVKLLKDVLATDPYKFRSTRESLGSLLRDDEASNADNDLRNIRFGHKSVPDWLRDSDRSLRYCVDPGPGLERLVDHLLGFAANPANLTPAQDSFTTFQQEQLGDVLANAGKWAELHELLLRDSTPLWPYWLQLTNFPAHIDRSTLLTRLRDHPDRNHFLGELQRRGDPQLLGIIEGISTLPGSRLDLHLANLHIDTVHLRGGYRDAVDICAQYLVARTPADLERNPELLRIAVRRLHHKMFYESVGPLLAEAHELLKLAQAGPDVGVTQELIFLIGGNLGLLSGDIGAAQPWLARALEEAKRDGNTDFQHRVLRKQADVMCVQGKHEEARAMLGQVVSPERGAASRYEVYLLAALAEAHRHLGQPARAIACYEAVERESVRRGIRGWEAHAHLGMALLLSGAGDQVGADVSLSKALGIYSALGQEWGLLNTGIVGSIIQSTSSQCDTSSKLKELLERAQYLQYGYEASVVQRLIRHGHDPNYHLLFL